MGLLLLSLGLGSIARLHHRALHLTLRVGVQWELPGAVARRDQGRTSGFLSQSGPVDRRFDGDLGSSFRPFPRRRPRSNGSARESSGSDVAGGREAALQPHRLHPPRRHPSSLEIGWMAQSAMVPDHRALETGRPDAKLLHRTSWRCGPDSEILSQRYD
jgi:hypothetical protein